MRDFEEGGIFARLGIANFLEADYFAWYLDERNEKVAKRAMSVVNRLSEYDPSAVELEPERIKDLFKRSHQNLVPKKDRSVTLVSMGSETYYICNEDVWRAKTSRQGHSKMA